MAAGSLTTEGNVHGHIPIPRKTVLETPATVGTIGAIHDAVFSKESIRASVFGRFFEDGNDLQDWTFKNLNGSPETLAQSSVGKYLPRIAEKLGVTEILAPSPVTFNGKMCSRHLLSKRVPVGDHLIVYRGAQADGCSLEPGQAFGISVGGCAVIVAWVAKPSAPDKPTQVAVGHAGLRSLERTKHDLPNSGTFSSIVHSLVHELGGASCAHHIFARVLLPIDPVVFTHPWKCKHTGVQNRMLTEHLLAKYGEHVVIGKPSRGCIDIAAIIEQQFIRLDVPRSNVEVLSSTSMYPDLVYTTRERQKKLRSHRNLVLVTRYR